MYDAVAEAMPLAQSGRHRKKALLIISDGNDTNSAGDRRRGQAPDPRERGAGLRDRHRRPEHACPPTAADRPASVSRRRSRSRSPCRAAAGRRRGRRAPRRMPRRSGLDDRVNADALREITDDSGGRTEIIRSPRDLDPGDRGHRRRVEQAVLARLSVDAAKTTAAGTRSPSRSIARDCASGATRVHCEVTVREPARILRVRQVRRFDRCCVRGFDRFDARFASLVRLKRRNERRPVRMPRIIRLRLRTVEPVAPSNQHLSNPSNLSNPRTDSIRSPATIPRAHVCGGRGVERPRQPRRAAHRLDLPAARRRPSRQAGAVAD